MTYLYKSSKEGFAVEFFPNHSYGTFKTEIKCINKGEEGLPSLETLTGRQGSTQCLFCGEETHGDKIRELIKEGKVGHQPIAKMFLELDGKKEKKVFKVIEEEDYIYIEKCNRLAENLKESYPPIPEYSGRGSQVTISVPRQYGVTSFKDVFIPRQRLVISILTNWINAAKNVIIKNDSKETADIIGLYLAFGLNKFLEISTQFNIWHSGGFPVQIAPKYGFIFAWDFPEINPFKDGGYSFLSKIKDVASAVSNIESISKPVKKVWRQNASEQSLLDSNSIDLIITDPPYYGMIMYAGMADFFYGLLRFTQENAFPNLFKENVTPKAKECVLQEHRYDNKVEANNAYENQLLDSFKEMNRVLKSDGILVVVFAHINLSAWEAIISAIVKAGFQITACWPINTERSENIKQGDAALVKDTMHLVCRKHQTKEKIAFFQDLQKIAEEKLEKKLKDFWKLGFSGANLDIAMFGPALELYGYYTKVEDERTGKLISVGQWLDFTQKKVLQLQLSQVMKDLLPLEKHKELESLDTFAQFYILFRFEFGCKKIEIDAIRLLEKIANISIKNLINWGYLKKEGSKISLLNANQRKNPDDIINGKPNSQIISLIDTLHGVILAQQRGIFKEFSIEKSISHQHPIWGLAQLLNIILPKTTDEASSLRKLLNLRKLDSQTRINDHL